MSGTAENVEVWSGKDRGDENFPVGSALIRPELRPIVHAYYAFARNADDIADSTELAPADKIARLNIMEDVLVGRRESGSPSATSLRARLAGTNVPVSHATDLLIAFRQDATRTRYDTIDELYEYCRYSAVPVGRFLVDLHGESQACHAPSDALCTALQVLNHMQDCAKDLAALDRCYLPMTLMHQHAARIEDLRASRETPGLRRVFAILLDRVDQLIQVARALPETARDRRLRLESAMILGLCRRLADRLARHDPLAQRVALSKLDFATRAVASLRYFWRFA